MTKTVYGVEDPKCGEAAISDTLAKLAEQLYHYKEGHCADEGYTQADGTETRTFPVAGDVTFNVFIKPTLQELSADQTMVYGLANGLCGELEIATSLVSSAAALGYKAGDCPDEGFKHEIAPKTMHFPIIGDVTVRQFDKNTLLNNLAADQTMVYGLANNLCGEVEIATSLVSAAAALGYKAGDCPDEGFKHEIAPKTMHFPVIGDVTVRQFDKNTLLNNLAADQTMVYGLANNLCGEVEIATSLVSAAAALGYKAGDCPDEGYKHEIAPKTMHFPVIGDVTVRQFDQKTLHLVNLNNLQFLIL